MLKAYNHCKVSALKYQCVLISVAGLRYSDLVNNTHFTIDLCNIAKNWDEEIYALLTTALYAFGLVLLYGVLL